MEPEIRDPKDLLRNVRIASPCDVDWDSMTGDERIRYCAQCKLSVFNVAELSADEAVDLISEQSGRVCLRLYRRRDGTLITRDCPVAVQKLKRLGRRAVAAALAAIAWIGLSPGEASAWSPEQIIDQVLGRNQMAGGISPDYVEKITTAKMQEECPPQHSPLTVPSVLGIAVLAIAYLKRKRAPLAIIGITLGGMFAIFGGLWASGLI